MKKIIIFLLLTTGIVSGQSLNMRLGTKSHYLYSKKDTSTVSAGPFSSAFSSAFDRYTILSEVFQIKPDLENIQFVLKMRKEDEEVFVSNNNNS